MIDEAIFTAQDYLTIEKDDVRKRIVDIEALNKKHSKKEIIAFLKDYFKSKERALKNLIMIDKTQRRVDETVVSMFRLSMAIKTLEDDLCIITISNRKEGTKIAQVKQGAEKGIRIPKRNSSSDCSARVGKDSGHDGKNRDAGQGIQRAA